MSNKLKIAAITTGLALGLTACGGTGAGEEDAAAPADAKVTVAVPFQSCLAWWPLYAAEDQGLFEENGVEVEIQGVDGGAATVQAVLSERADVAMGSPDNFLASVAQGADVTSWYAFYQRPTFSLVTTADSGISDLSQLKDKTVGISTPAGGDVPYSESLLMFSAGLGAGVDYEQLAVGSGSSAAKALEDGTVAAYSASYFDEAVIEAGGVELNTLTDPDFPAVVGQLFISTSQWADSNSGTVDSFGRALAQGTAWGLENRDEVVEICGKANPEETEDLDFAKVIVDRVADLVELPSSVKGYGWIDDSALATYRDLLIELGTVPESASKAEVDNSHVDRWNSK